MYVVSFELLHGIDRQCNTNVLRNGSIGTNDHL